MVKEHGEKLSFLYEYDFGDGWSHKVKLEKVLDEAEPDEHYPRCVDGENACPPEDVGGVWGYADLLEAINDPDHPQHEDMLEWHGEFDPTEFNPKTVSAYWEAESIDVIGYLARPLTAIPIYMMKRVSSRR